MIVLFTDFGLQGPYRKLAAIIVRSGMPLIICSNLEFARQYLSDSWRVFAAS
jgi:hypothetical protein